MNMKKYCLVAILLSLLMSMPLSAYDFVQNGIYYDIEGDHVSVTYSGNGVYTGSVSIPNQVTYNGVTYPVTAIGEWAFEGGEGMTYLSIPSSITSIGEYAFIDCGSNIEVRIADLTAWCKVEFGNVHSSPLSSAKKFYLNTSSYETKSLSIPNGVEAISNFAFYQCRSITSLSIAGSVKTIGSSTFEDCTGLTSIYLNNGLESIGGSSFEGCKGLSSVKLPNSVKSIAINAFKNCSGLTSLTLNEGLESIGISSFEGCTGISAITLPSSLTSIDIDAFSGCSKLNVIVSKIQSPFAIDENVFNTYYSAILYVPEGTISTYKTTAGWKRFVNINDGKRTISVVKAGTLPNLISNDEKYQIKQLILSGELNGTDFYFIRQMAGTDYRERSGPPELISTPGQLYLLDLADAKIVEGGEDYLQDYWGARAGTRTGGGNHRTKNNCISSLLFENTKLQSIIIPSSVTSIDVSAFYNCRVLKTLIVGGNNQIYDSRDNCNAIITKSTNQLIVGCMNSVIPNGVKSIGSSAFSGCSGLTSVTIPNSVTSIGSSAFSSCSGLTSVTIPNSVTSIGSSAFFGCSRLTSVNIPNSVASIGSNAFYNCSGLSSVTIPNSVTSIGSSAFYNCTSLTSIKVEKGNQYYDSRNNCNAIIEISTNTLIVGCQNTTIPNSVTSIGSNAFYNCGGLTSVTIPNSVTSIGNSAFYGCSGLTYVVSEIVNPYKIGTSDFYSSGKDIYATATLLVPKGKKSAYQTTEGWSKFKIIKDNINGDVNLDEILNKTDTKDLVTYIMGENTGNVNEYKADVNRDQEVNAADVVTLVDILNNGGLSTDSQFDFDNVDGNLVVASLTCTLNNKRDEAIQLTRCELYCKGNLVSYKNFSDCSLAAGVRQDCSFNNLVKHAAGTKDFTVCWHFVVNGENFVYRCKLDD